MRAFKAALQNLHWHEVYACNKTDASFEIFWDIFYSLFNLHFPLSTRKLNRNIHPKNEFMTPGLLVSRNNKIKLHALSLSKPTLFLHKYKQYRNIYNSLLRASKKLYYDYQLKKFSKNPKRTWELINELSNGGKKQTPISKLDVNGKIIDKADEIADEFNFFATAGKNVAESVPSVSKPRESYIPNLETPDFVMGNMGPVHLTDILKSFPNKASLDSDSISLKLVKFVAIEISSPLAHIFNLSLDNGIFPARLKNRTVPIFKNGDSMSCDNYRPISLIATFSKIIEKIVAVNLTNHLQINKLLYSHQYGFQRFLSTEQNLIQVVNNIGAALNRGNYCIGIFLDLRKAFYTCSHDILLKKLSKLGVKGTTLAWFSSYLSNRTQQVNVNGNLSSQLEITYGVLQGSILGPLLFLCYINDIYTSTELATFLFADDTTCLAEHNNLSDLVNL
jgi:hypothetical protein